MKKNIKNLFRLKAKVGLVESYLRKWNVEH